MLFCFKLMGALVSSLSSLSSFYFDPNRMGRIQRYVGDVLRPLLPSDRYSCYFFFPPSFDLEHKGAGRTHETKGGDKHKGLNLALLCLYSSPINKKGFYLLPRATLLFSFHSPNMWLFVCSGLQEQLSIMGEGFCQAGGGNNHILFFSSAS